MMFDACIHACMSCIKWAGISELFLDISQTYFTGLLALVTIRYYKLLKSHELSYLPIFLSSLSPISMNCIKVSMIEVVYTLRGAGLAQW